MLNVVTRMYVEFGELKVIGCRKSKFLFFFKIPLNTCLKVKENE